VALTSFVGRDRAVDDVRRALRTHRLVTVLGPGGVGKTRLAIEAARDRSDHGEPNRVWFAELAPVTGEEDLVPAVLSAMGQLEVSVLDRPRTAPHDLHGRLLDTVADCDGVLVLDNCEHLIDVIAQLTEQLLAVGPRLRVLATSREALRLIGEYGYQLDGLTVPGRDADVEAARGCSAVRLFIERATSVDHGFTLDAGSLPAVREICRRLDGQPLAIELAAARLRTLTVSEVADRLGDRFRLLTGGSRTLPRHRTLRAVVEWSWDLLDDRERDLAERIAVFPSGVTTTSAAAVFDDADDTAELLESLADKSLLVPVRGQGRFRMLETLREYGAERLVDRGIIEKVRSAHLDYFVTLGEELGIQLNDVRQVAAIARIDAERGNLTAALRFAVDRADRPRAARLVRALSVYWAIRNEQTELIALALSVLDLPGSAPPDVEIALLGVALLANVMRESDRHPTDDLIAAILTIWDAHHPDDGFTLIVMSALQFFDRIGDRVLPEPTDRRTRAVIGMVRLALLENAGRTDGMAELLAETLEGMRASGDPWALAITLGMRGAIQAYDGDLDGATASWQEALPLLVSLGAEQDAAFTRQRLLGLRIATADADQLGQAHRELTAEYDLAMRHRDPQTAAMAQLALATIDRLTGNHQAAAARARAILNQNATLEHPFGGGQFAGMARSVLALALIGSPDEADQRAAGDEVAAAVRVALPTQDMPVVAQVLTAAAVVAHRWGDPTRAARLLGAADGLRGRPDRSSRDALELVATLCDLLGTETYTALHDEGARLDRDAAAALATQPGEPGSLDRVDQTLRR
jgi:predicted ATPase